MSKRLLLADDSITIQKVIQITFAHEDYELTITDMIEEGTLVDSGDYVATLDHKAVEEQIKLAQDELDRMLSEYEDSKIDSNLNLSNQRDLIVNANKIRSIL